MLGMINRTDRASTWIGESKASMADSSAYAGEGTVVCTCVEAEAVSTIETVHSEVEEGEGDRLQSHNIDTRKPRATSTPCIV